MKGDSKLPVAKSYANLKVLSEPYVREKKKYVKVLSAKGTEKEVRWYTEEEYYRMYPELRPTTCFNPEIAFGFAPKGYIIIFKGNDELYFKAHDEFQFATHLGWFMKSKFTLPTDLPPALIPIQLTWVDVSEEGEMYDADTVKLICDRKRLGL